MDQDVLRREAVMPLSLEHTQKGNSYFGLQSRALNLSLRCNLAVKNVGFFSFFFPELRVNIFSRIE